MMDEAYDSERAYVPSDQEHLGYHLVQLRASGAEAFGTSRDSKWEILGQAHQPDLLPNDAGGLGRLMASSGSL